jgi:tripartite-type tricarboxylate transporter receptor subunit TctC
VGADRAQPGPAGGAGPRPVGRNRFRHAHLAAVVAASLAVPAAIAQPYPQRPVRFIVPFAPGGTSDIVGRLMGTALGEELGQTFVIDNRAGAGATIGTAIVARAPADGYTLLVSHSGMAINETLYAKLPYDALADFAPISLVGVAPSAVVVTNTLPVRNMVDLIALAKKDPGKLTYGSAGVGSVGHLAVALLEYVSGTRFSHVPYKGGAPSVLATMTGEVNFSIPTLPSATPQVKAGKLRMIAVTTAKRSSVVPDVPTVAESGVPKYVYEVWHALFAPAKTPRLILDRLSKATLKVMENQELRAQLAAQGIEPTPSTPAQLDKLLRHDIALWAATIKAAGIPIN